MLDALSRAAAEPAGLPLHGGRAAPRCRDEGLLHLVGTEPRGKAVQERWAITERGLAYLLRQASPKQVLEDLVRTLEARQGQVAELVATAQQTRASLEALKAAAE